MRCLKSKCFFHLSVNVTLWIVACLFVTFISLASRRIWVRREGIYELYFAGTLYAFLKYPWHPQQFLTLFLQLAWTSSFCTCAYSSFQTLCKLFFFFLFWILCFFWIWMLSFLSEHIVIAIAVNSWFCRLQAKQVLLSGCYNLHLISTTVFSMKY